MPDCPALMAGTRVMQMQRGMWHQMVICTVISICAQVSTNDLPVSEGEAEPPTLVGGPRAWAG